MKIARGEGGEIAALWYKHRAVPIVPLSELRSSCRGLLTATGPPVKALRFENIPAMPAIGVNGAYCPHRQLDFRFYVIVDMGFIDNRPEIVRDVIQRPGLTLFTTARRGAHSRSLWPGGDRLPIGDRRRRAACKIYRPGSTAARCGITTAGKTAWSLPPRAACSALAGISAAAFDAGTVAYWALQIIAYLGFKQLFIAGLDMNNFHQPRFYETEQDRLPTFPADKVKSLVIPAFDTPARSEKAADRD